MGSIPYADAAGTGVTFRVWAPNATAVGVKGQFNGWATTTMASEGTNNLWSVDVPNAQAGQEYKFRINNSFDKRDPRARRVTSSVGNSIVYRTNAFDWGSAPTPTPWRNDIVHYQMHVGTFEGGTPPRTFDQAISRLDHVKNLGISSIKLMPVAEFAGNHSWGYNPADLFAIESAYGGPDAMKRFMKACHERGIAVFMDIVHNHYGTGDLDIWRFDGWGSGDFGGIYFYNDSRAYTPWGVTRPDFGRPEVYSFIRDQVMMYVKEYRIGGFRWDSVYNIINTDNGYNQQGHHLLRDINWELSQQYPHVVRGSEDNAFDYNMNFENQWDVGYRWGLHGQVVNSSDAARDMFAVKGLLDGWPGHHRVVFSEAHDYIARTHNRSRIPSEIDSANPTSIWARKRALLAAGIVMTTPGIPMIFQGQEFHETLAFHDDTPLRWSLTNTFSGIVRAYRDLIHARRNLRGGTQGLKGVGVNVHHVDNNNKVVGFIRWDQGGQADDVVVVANFASTRWTNHNYAIEFPSAGTWYRHFNSDDADYQPDFDGIGADQVEAAGSPATAIVNMGRYSLQIFSKTPPATPAGAASFSPSPINGCVDVTITYAPNEGPLKGVSPLYVDVARDGGLDLVTGSMTQVNSNTFTYVYAVPEGTHQLNVAFHDGAATNRVRDDNNGAGWNVPVYGCGVTSVVSIVITNPASDITVAHAVTQALLQGESGLLVGAIRWTNHLTGGSGTVPATSFWSAGFVPLAVGTNLLAVSGAGAPPPGGIIATDAASQGAYLDGWQGGDNGGTGLAPWHLAASGGNAGFFLATSANNARLNLSSPAWGLWANSGDTADAYRPFGFALRSGDTVRVRFENNWINTGSSAGVALVNSNNEFLAEFYFTGGQSTYRLSDSVAGRDTGIGYTDAGLTLAFTLTGTNAYRLQAGAATITGTFAARADGGAAKLRIWNFNAGPGEDYNVYANDLTISNAVGVAAPVSDAVTVVRLGLLPPVFAPLGGQTAVTAVATSFVVAAVGDPVPVVALAGTTASGGYVFDAESGLLTYTPPHVDAGGRAFTFVASNAAGVATQIVAVSVQQGPPDAPAAPWIAQTNAFDAVAAWMVAGGAASYRLDVHTAADFLGEHPGPTGIETFSGMGVGSSSYQTRIWTNQGIVWTAYKARTDQTLEGPAIGLRNESGAYLVSSVITGGVDALSIAARRGSGSGTYSIYVNGIRVATNITLTSSAVTTQVAGIGIEGPFTLMVSNGGTTRATFDNLRWVGAPIPGGVFVPGYSNRAVAGTGDAITGLTAQTTYHLRVRSINGAGESAWSPATAFVTAEPPPPDANSNQVPDSWELEHFGDLQTVSGTSDYDGDGMPDVHEYVAGTQPTNAASFLWVEYGGQSDGSGTIIRWSSVSNRTYDLGRKSSLTDPFHYLATNLPATPPLNLHTDTPPSDIWYYRVRVSP